MIPIESTLPSTNSSKQFKDDISFNNPDTVEIIEFKMEVENEKDT
jgi:hypothetical protein